MTYAETISRARQRLADPADYQKHNLYPGWVEDTLPQVPDSGPCAAMGAVCWAEGGWPRTITFALLTEAVQTLYRGRLISERDVFGFTAFDLHRHTMHFEVMEVFGLAIDLARRRDRRDKSVRMCNGEISGVPWMEIRNVEANVAAKRPMIAPDSFIAERRSFRSLY